MPATRGRSRTKASSSRRPGSTTPPRRPRRADAQPGGTPRRLPRAARCAATRRARASTISAPATGATASPRRWTSSTTTPSGVVRAGDRRDARRPLRGERRPRAGRRRARDPSRRDDRRGRARASTSPAPTPQHDGNLNCPLAVTRSACYFVVRCLDRPGYSRVGRRVRAGHGARTRRMARQRAAAGCRRRRQHRDVLPHRRRRLRALRAGGRRPAQGQGTMNNVTLGNDRFTYYETIGGGQGACPDADGPSGVHVTMSNTLNTPVEALELSYPLRVERYALRLGAGGAGPHRGGDGVVRELRVLEDCRRLDPQRAPAHAPQRRAGRRGRRARTQPRQRRASCRRRTTRELRAGDVRHDRDARAAAARRLGSSRMGEVVAINIGPAAAAAAAGRTRRRARRQRARRQPLLLRGRRRSRGQRAHADRRPKRSRHGRASTASRSPRGESGGTS